MSVLERVLEESLSRLPNGWVFCGLAMSGAGIVTFHAHQTVAPVVDYATWNLLSDATVHHVVRVLGWGQFVCGLFLIRFGVKKARQRDEAASSDDKNEDHPPGGLIRNHAPGLVAA